MSERRLTAAVFAAAFALIALLTKPQIVSWNDASRFATIDALTHQHTFAIEGSRYVDATKDKYAYAGHIYSDKPPALALQGTVVASAIAPLGLELGAKRSAAIYAIVLFTVGLWFAAGCTYAYAFSRMLGAGERLAVLVAALTGAGTLILPYGTVLANHVPAGAAALAGAYHLLRSRAVWGHAVAAGILFSLAYAFDPAAVVFVVFASVMLWRTPPRRWGVVALAAAPIVAAQLAFNLAVSGSVEPPALNQSSWNDQASPFYRGPAQSAFFFDSPRSYAAYAAYVLVGAKGLISYTPLVLVAAYGYVLWFASGGVPRRLTIAVGATVCLYVALIVAFTDDYGARNYGERRYVDLMFLLCAGLTPALAALRGRLGAIAARVLAVLSIAAAALGTIAPFGGKLGQVGFVVAGREFVHIASRAPVQAALDVVLLLAIVVAVLRAWPRDQGLLGTTVFVERSGSQTR
jgi:hypothetical protein